MLPPVTRARSDRRRLRLEDVYVDCCTTYSLSLVSVNGSMRRRRSRRARGEGLLVAATASEMAIGRARRPGESARAEAQGDDAAQDASAVAQAVQAALAVLPRAAVHRDLDDVPAGAQHAEEQIDLDVEAVGAQADATQRL